MAKDCTDCKEKDLMIRDREHLLAAMAESCDRLHGAKPEEVVELRLMLGRSRYRLGEVEAGRIEA